MKYTLKRAVFVALASGLYCSPAFALVALIPNGNVAVGSGASAIGNNDVAIGGGTSANGSNNTNINGRLPNDYQTLGNDGTVAQSTSPGGTGSGGTQNSVTATVLGDNATVYRNNSSYYQPGTSIGYQSASNGYGTALGSNAQAGSASANDAPTTVANDTAVGGNIYSGSGNTAVGGGTVTTGDNNIAVGSQALSSGGGSIAIGNNAAAGNPQVPLDPSTAVGSGATATGTDSEAYGYNAQATATDSEALGTNAQAGQANSVALGSGSTANTEQTGQGSTIMIRGQSYSVAGAAPSGEVSVGSASQGTTRLITNVAAGQISSTSTQAVNGSELYATNQAINNLRVTQASQGVLHYTNPDGSTSLAPTSTASAGTATTGPVVISNVGAGAVSPDSTQAVNGGQLYSAEGQAQAEANQAQAAAEGYASGVAAQDAGQALQAANAHSNGLFTLTCHRLGNGSGDIVCGRGSSVSGRDAMAQGTGAQSSGQDATAYGAGSIANGQAATAIGPNAVANGYSTTALGDHAQALAPNSTALGENATANGSNSVALGQGSVANRPNSVSVGDAATHTYRQITNVAAGTEPHDAVNLGQFEAGLRGLKSYANAEADKVGSVDASLAAASAEAAAGKHRNTIAGGTAEYNGQASFAFAYQHRFNTHWAAMMTVGSNGGASNTTVAGAASYSW